MAHYLPSFAHEDRKSLGRSSFLPKITMLAKFKVTESMTQDLSPKPTFFSMSVGCLSRSPDKNATVWWNHILQSLAWDKYYITIAAQLIKLCFRVDKVLSEVFLIDIMYFLSIVQVDKLLKLHLVFGKKKKSVTNQQLGEQGYSCAPSAAAQGPSGQGRWKKHLIPWSRCKLVFSEHVQWSRNNRMFLGGPGGFW